MELNWIECSVLNINIELVQRPVSRSRKKRAGFYWRLSEYCSSFFLQFRKLSILNKTNNQLAMEIEFDINSVDKLPDRKYECK